MLNEKEFLKEISYLISKECESKEKSFEKIKEYIENEGDINIRFPDLGDTALMRLSKHANCILTIQLALLLIQNDKCDLNIQDFAKNSALINAILFDNYEIAESLIKDERCNLNLQNELLNNALLVCCNKTKNTKNTNIAKLLIENNDCNLNLRSVYNQDTALMISFSKKYYEIAELLIRNKRCDVNLRNSFGSTVLLYLQDRRRYACILPDSSEDFRTEEHLLKLLMQREDILFDLLDRFERPFPINAIISDDKTIINQLLLNKSFKLNINSPNTSGIFNIPDDMLKLFMQHKKFDWNAKSQCKISTFRRILYRGLSTIFIKEFEQAINDKECDVNEIFDITGNTFLIYICAFEIYDSKNTPESLTQLARILINSDNCDINVKNNQGQTAFWYACKKNKKSFVELFLQSKKFIMDESIIYPNYENLIIEPSIKKRTRMGVLLMSIKTCQKMDSKKRKTELIEENPFKILPKELIHLTLSYAYPFIPQTKYCKNE